MLETLLAWLVTYKYLVIFPVAVVEGPIIAIVCGSLAAAGQIDFLIAYVIIVCGDEFADSLIYLFGRYSRTNLVNRWGKYIGFSPKRIGHLDRQFANHAGKMLILGKFAFSFEIPFILAAGLARFPYPKFITYMTLGAIPKTLALMLVGYLFGFSVVAARHDLIVAGRFVLAALCLLALLYAIHYFAKRNAFVNIRRKFFRFVKRVLHESRARR